jgi:hypothetical protein
MPITQHNMRNLLTDFSTLLSWITLIADFWITWHGHVHNFFQSSAMQSISPSAHCNFFNNRYFTKWSLTLLYTQCCWGRPYQGIAQYLSVQQHPDYLQIRRPNTTLVMDWSGSIDLTRLDWLPSFAAATPTVNAWAASYIRKLQNSNDTPRTRNVRIYNWISQNSILSRMLVSTDKSKARVTYLAIGSNGKSRAPNPPGFDSPPASTSPSPPTLPMPDCFRSSPVTCRFRPPMAPQLCLPSVAVRVNG